MLDRLGKGIIGRMEEPEVAGTETGTGKRYVGERTIDGCQVLVDGEPLDEALEVRAISSDGFEWSYEGEGPEQLAFAILYDHFGDAERASARCTSFMRAVVANFNNDWEMTTHDIDRALENIGTTA
ncbi:hypothetical protein LNKW23_16230 [Paralimibaculum aggregatum]|uniref:Uncharacterized protein n=1 Tax=Paralimibaculum aggregatum TaxID=3036245 RepID=A0ABQ6LGH5_9RHOB|nr:DUF6166 domain-containing protein [Limibaculum sp. NKW23]GMG82410.1 hypothetical protein LNKW23_16230 [Limibaculum sp. NKW23]